MKSLVTTNRRTVKALKQLNDSPATVYLNSLAPSGRRSMRSQLQSILNSLKYKGDVETFPWSKLRYAHIAKIQNGLLVSGKSISTANTTIAAIKGVMRAAFNLGQLNGEAYIRIQSIKRVNHHQLPAGRSLRPREIKKMLDNCQQEKTCQGTRDAAIIALLAATGLRRSELVAININDYDRKQGQLIVQSGKGNRQRIASIPKASKKWLSKWLALRNKKTGPLFTRIISGESTNTGITAQTIYNILQARSENAGIKVCTPHDLRRTLVTRLLDSGVDINTVRQIVGHQDINTTARYDRRDERIKNKVIQKLIVF